MRKRRSTTVCAESTSVSATYETVSSGGSCCADAGSDTRWSEGRDAGEVGARDGTAPESGVWAFDGRDVDALAFDALAFDAPGFDAPAFDAFGSLAGDGEEDEGMSRDHSEEA